MYTISQLVGPESVMIATTLMVFQVYRRLYECTCISVYSDAKINVAYYFVGYFFYFCVGLSLVAEAPSFAGQGLS